ncbi:glycosyltransferase family 24 protein [Peniophora sp. CONT]|nr:glycosyltransferase family 24 protein [Peniophora sp. CONT]
MGFITKPGAYTYPETKSVPSTMYVVANFYTEEGLAVVQYALTYLSTVEDASSRISFIHNPATPADDKTSTSVSALFSHLIANERLGSLTPALLLHALKLHVPSDDLEQYEGGKRVVPALTALGEAWEGLNRLDDGEIAAFVSNVASIVSDVRIPDPSESGLYNSQLSSRNTNYRRLSTSIHTMFKVGDGEGAQIRFGMILDPLSGDAQRCPALLEWVYSQPDVYAEVYLMPPPYTELPLKRLYRYNLLPQLVYDESGNEVASVSSFEDLPIEPIYTLGLDEPSSWFRATSGVYALEIREGKGREIYEIESVGNEGWKSPSVAEGGDVVTITSFEGLALYPRLMRKSGMERAGVLEEDEDDEESESVLGSVVSGYALSSRMLYERFASIMTLSVMRHTNQTVKFCFIENFLSPSFLEYGFQYELVTYKWPKWLRAQTEKQPIIWAYKILFLDVLFPMDLDRVIFVDADQIVRADLMELVGVDLEGAPYGYTPMDDDHTDMEGFGFWKQGYWAQALQGKPYHISALYVIDLKRFRQLAAGDVLRSHYQELSADPHSLANLDQDLPNNLQRYVPIFSLPEDWLWCETWRSKDQLDRAKTIDLCQNPLTKEPKLARARQIPEWEVYDSEIARLARRLADEGVIHASAAAADVSDLANAASGKAIRTGESHEPDADSSEEEDKHVRHEEL